MIFNFSEKDGKKGIFVIENKDNMYQSKSGKAVSFLIGEKSNIVLSINKKEKVITGADLIKLLFKK